jgi:hypothetical protein
MNRKELQNLAHNAIAIVTQNGTCNPAPVFSASTTARLISECGSAFMKAALAVSSIEKVTYKTLSHIANNYFCMHCDKRVPDYRGNCISVCGPCVAAGVNPRDYKAKRAEKTCLEAYGVRNVFQTDWAKQKMAVTNKLRYGAPNPASAESALRADMNAYLKTSGKKREQSRRKTMSTKYGAEHWTRVPELVDRFQSNLEDKHGSEVTNVMHIPEVRALHTKRMSELTEQGFWKGIYDTKVREVLIEKYGVPNIFFDEKYMRQKRSDATGFDYPLQDPRARAKFEKTQMERRGVRHHMHDPEIFAKTMRNRRINVYEVLFKKRAFHVVGTYEVFVLRCLLSKYKPKDIYSGFEVDPLEVGNKRYYPDFYIGSKDTFIEVKSLYTLLGDEKDTREYLKKNKIKARACDDQGIKVAWVIAEPKLGKVIFLPSDWFTLNRTALLNLVQDQLEVAENKLAIPAHQAPSRLLHSVRKPA